MQSNLATARLRHARQASLRLLLALLPAGTLTGAASAILLLPPPGPPRVPRPYLREISPPALRFQEAVSAADPVIRPPAGAPPQPEPVPAAITAPGPDPAPPPTTPPPVEPPVPAAPPAADPAPAKSTPAPPPILRDDLQPRVRIEDFLPFFEPPGRSPESARARAPDAIPPSTATYRQQ